jgi:cytidylate kinase
MPQEASEVRIVCIDGPAGAGKTTVARTVAATLGLPLLDTGAIYRSVALVAKRAGVDWSDAPGLARIAAKLTIAFVPADGGQRVVVDGADVSAAIRTPEISEGASRVSAHPEVRAELLEIQRRLASAAGCVAEGRDMGTVVFPDSPHKFFVTADLSTRARRRHAELERRGTPQPLEEVEREMGIRDERDSTRATAPLVQSDDAELVDTSQMSIDEVVARVLARLRGDSAS